MGNGALRRKPQFSNDLESTKSFGLKAKTKGILLNSGSDPQDDIIRQQRELVSLGLDLGGPGKDEVVS